MLLSWDRMIFAVSCSVKSVREVENTYDLIHETQRTIDVNLSSFSLEYNRATQLISNSDCLLFKLQSVVVLTWWGKSCSTRECTA
jgi:hypothetical protein